MAASKVSTVHLKADGGLFEFVGEQLASSRAWKYYESAKKKGMKRVEVHGRLLDPKLNQLKSCLTTKNAEHAGLEAFKLQY